MQTRSAPRAAHSSLVVLLALLSGFGCTSGGAGCSTLTPYPAGTRYMGPKNDNAINIRLSANGINYLNSNWQTLIGAFAPGAMLNLPVACTKQTVSVLGDVYIADQGGPNGGKLDAACDSKDVPANVAVTVTGFSLAPRAPDLLDATLQLSINTGKIFLTNPHTLCDLKCSIDFNTARASPNDNRLTATVKFSIDTRFDNLLAFEVATINGTQICGASGAPAKPSCLDPSDLALNSEGGFCSTACDAADWDPIKNFVLQQISGPLQTQVKSAISAQTCWACTTNADCPADSSGAASTCDTSAKVCMAGSKCVPRFLGVEGTLNLASFLGAFGAPADSKMELSVAAGSSVAMDQGMSFGTRVGIKPSTVSTCVPPQAAPPMTAVTAPNFDAEATPNSGYHVGLGISSNFLNGAFWAAQQAGALCLNLSSDNVGLINTGLFKTFLPSLGKLATRDGKDAPMMVVLRPARPPQVTVGEGTYDPVTKKPIKPLLLITLPDLSIDFYALIDDREVRLFTLTADISLPLSLIFEGCDKVTPAIGDLKMLIANIRTGNSEILAEDPQVLADLVPAVIGLAEPAVASGLSGFALPSLGSFKLKVNEVKGLGRIAGTDAFNHLGLYAQLLPANAMCAVTAPQLAVALKDSRMPQASAMRATGRGELPWPEAVLDVRTFGSTGSAEFSVKIDEGLWSDFLPAKANELVVSHPRFLLQGTHVIHVRARLAEEPQGISSERSVGFKVDWEAPELSLKADESADRIVVSARDVVSGDKLEFAYRVGEGATSAFGPAREIALSAVEAQGGVTVFARDELGNVGEASWKPPQVALRPELSAELPDSGTTQAGCSTTGGFGLLALGALVLLRRRRD